MIPFALIPNPMTMSASSVQHAHDALLANMPEGVSHSCSLCASGPDQKVKEVAGVADARTFSEAEHFALLTDAVARETAELRTAKEELEARVSTGAAEKAAQVSELQSRIDVLEVEKAAAEKAREEAVAEFDSYKTTLAEKAAVEARKADRIAAVKAASEDLDEAYFTEARVQRWAEMADEAFDLLLADLKEAAAMKPGAKKAPKKKADGAEDDAADDDDADDTKQKARETSAFTGGESPRAATGSVFGQYLTAVGKLPTATR